MPSKTPRSKSGSVSPSSRSATQSPAAAPVGSAEDAMVRESTEPYTDDKTRDGRIKGWIASNPSANGGNKIPANPKDFPSVERNDKGLWYSAAIVVTGPEANSLSKFEAQLLILGFNFHRCLDEKKDGSQKEEWETRCDYIGPCKCGQFFQRCTEEFAFVTKKNVEDLLQSFATSSINPANRSVGYLADRLNAAAGWVVIVGLHVSGKEKGDGSAPPPDCTIVPRHPNGDGKWLHCTLIITEALGTTRARLYVLPTDAAGTSQTPVTIGGVPYIAVMATERVDARVYDKMRKDKPERRENNAASLQSQFDQQLAMLAGKTPALGHALFDAVRFEVTRLKAYSAAVKHLYDMRREAFNSLAHTDAIEKLMLASPVTTEQWYEAFEDVCNSLGAFQENLIAEAGRATVSWENYVKKNTVHGVLIYSNRDLVPNAAFHQWRQRCPVEWCDNFDQHDPTTCGGISGSRSFLHPKPDTRTFQALKRATLKDLSLKARGALATVWVDPGDDV